MPRLAAVGLAVGYLSARSSSQSLRGLATQEQPANLLYVDTWCGDVSLYDNWPGTGPNFTLSSCGALCSEQPSCGFYVYGRDYRLGGFQRCTTFSTCYLRYQYIDGECDVYTREANIVQENAPGVGGWGGSCTCPDGQVYWVGDDLNACESIACLNGVSGECIRTFGNWSKRRVVCARGGEDTTTIESSTTTSKTEPSTTSSTTQLATTSSTVSLTTAPSGNLTTMAPTTTTNPMNSVITETWFAILCATRERVVCEDAVCESPVNGIRKCNCQRINATRAVFPSEMAGAPALTGALGGVAMCIKGNLDGELYSSFADDTPVENLRLAKCQVPADFPFCWGAPCFANATHPNRATCDCSAYSLQSQPVTGESYFVVEDDIECRPNWVPDACSTVMNAGKNWMATPISAYIPPTYVQEEVCNE